MLFGRILHLSGLSTVEKINEDEYTERLLPNGKKKTKKQMRAEIKADLQRQIKDNDQKGFLLFANAHTLYKLGELGQQKNRLPDDFGFDLILYEYCHSWYITCIVVKASG